MNQIIKYSIFFVTIVLFLNSCKKEEQEVPAIGKVYINNQLYPNNEYKLNIKALLDRQNNNAVLSEVISGDTLCSFPIRVTLPVKEKTVVKCAVSETNLEEYNKQNNTTYMLFPSENYKIEKSEVTIEAGQMVSQDSIVIRFSSKSSSLDFSKDYLLPVSISSVSNSSVAISSNMSSVKVFSTLDISVDNIEATNLPIEGTAFNSSITFESNKTSMNLNVLKDGNFSRVWYPGNTSTYLAINLPQEEKIKGIQINTASGTYQLATCEIKVEEGRGYISHGTFSTSEKVTALYVKFKIPVTTKSIRIERMLTVRGNQQPDLTEVNLIR